MNKSSIHFAPQLTDYSIIIFNGTYKTIQNKLTTQWRRICICVCVCVCMYVSQVGSEKCQKSPPWPFFVSWFFYQENRVDIFLLTNTI